ncbi:hypothetical protein K7432_011094 [Basidiobolus ranarum]|uniref:Uncharacterized protein n=1 Tax=Basidiobolus ranarum TaxID=34480 RepID=A0ABR2VUF9_9FUNG
MINKKGQFEDENVTEISDDGLIEISEQGVTAWSVGQKQNGNANSAMPNSRIKEKSKCMKREEIQELHSLPMNENKEVQFGHARLIEVSVEEPVISSPKEEKTLELYSTSDTQKSQIEKMGKVMETEEAQALRKPSTRIETK